MSRQNSYSDEQINAARFANLAEYFERNGYKCEPIKNTSEIHVRGFGGLFVNSDKNSWYLHSEEKGGFNSIDCLQQILGKSFSAAVYELTGVDNYQSYEKTAPIFPKSNQSISKPKTEFIQPEKADNIKKVFAFLCQTRKIDKTIVSKLISDRKLFQDKNGNAVFPHYDENGKMIGAELQGSYTYMKTNSETNESEPFRFQGVATGTRGTVFQINVGIPEKVYVFESAIDLLSFYQMADKTKLQNCALISMGGLKKESLKPFIEKGLKLISCVDNDVAGRKFNAGLGLKSGSLLEREKVKDWNELLQKRHAESNKSPQNFKQNPEQKKSAKPKRH